MFAKVYSMGIVGLDSFTVTVEIDVSQGLPRFDLVGLPDTAVKESRDRVRAAIKNCAFTFPVSRMTVNIAPADVKKEGSLYDLPVLMSVLLATKQIKYDFSTSVLIGEVSLNGEIRRVNGVLPMLLEARKNGFSTAFIPKATSLKRRWLTALTCTRLKVFTSLWRTLTAKLFYSLFLTLK